MISSKKILLKLPSIPELLLPFSNPVEKEADNE